MIPGVVVLEEVVLNAGNGAVHVAYSVGTLTPPEQLTHPAAPVVVVVAPDAVYVNVNGIYPVAQV